MRLFKMGINLALLLVTVALASGSYSIAYAVNSTAIPFSQIVADVIQADQNSVWVIMPDYSFTQLQTYGQYHQSAAKCHGVPAAVTDSYATTYLMGHLTNSQNVIIDTNPSYISQSNCGSPSGIPSASPIVGIAGPGVNEVLYYYISTVSGSQLYYDFNTNCIARRDTGAAVICDSNTSTQDVFVIESFVDSQGRPVYLLWGKGYLGTLASVAYVAEFVAKNPTAYSASWYVYKWNDALSGPSANSIPDGGDTFTLVADSTTVTTTTTTTTTTNNAPSSGSAMVAWQYFAYGNGINPASKLPRGWIGGNWFNFWDLGMALDGTIGAFSAGLIGITEYQARVDALLHHLETMQLDANGRPFYAYAWDTGAPAWNQGMDAADSGRTLNALGFLRRSDPSYSSRIDTFLSGRGKPWIDALSTWGLTVGVYGRDLALGLTYFRYLSNQYDKTDWLNNFYMKWTSSDRITDAYGNSMPKLAEVNMGPVAYELLEKGEDYSRTVTYASDMKAWACKRHQATGKTSLWGTEFHVKLSDGSTPFAWEMYVAYVPNVGYKTWQVKLIDGRFLDETDPTISSTVSSLDVAYALRVTFPTDPWVTSVFPRFTQSDLTTNSGFYESVYETTNTAEPLASIPHNAVAVVAGI